MIHLRDITKSYGSPEKGAQSRIQILKGISLDIRPATVTAIVGPSGAGKTTLLQIIGTLDRPDSGSVMYHDTNVFSLKDNSLSHFRNQNIGFVFQNHRLLPEFSILENVAIPALIARIPRRQALQNAREILSSLNLSHRLDHRPSQLSGGECQRAAVARAMINKPQVILADEPTGSLDSANRTELHNIFLDICNKNNTTFVIVTHDENLAKQSHRIIHIVDGHITSDSNP